jgi:hypothetical protein
VGSGITPPAFTLEAVIIDLANRRGSTVLPFCGGSVPRSPPLFTRRCQTCGLIKLWEGQDEWRVYDRVSRSGAGIWGGWRHPSLVDSQGTVLLRTFTPDWNEAMLMFDISAAYQLLVAQAKVAIRRMFVERPQHVAEAPRGNATTVDAMGDDAAWNDVVDEYAARFDTLSGRLDTLYDWWWDHVHEADAAYLRFLDWRLEPLTDALLSFDTWFWLMLGLGEGDRGGGSAYLGEGFAANRPR